MPSSGYTAVVFTANEQPTTAKWNLLGSNDSAFNLGTGLEDATIHSRHIDGIAKNLLTTDSNPYKARAFAAANQSIADVTSTQITFGTESYDTNNNFASSAYTAPVSGFYMVNAGSRLSTGGFGVSYTMDVKKNGTIIASRLMSPYPAATTYGDATLDYSDILQLTAGDVLTFFATVDTSNSSAASVIGAASIAHTYCSFALLSRT